MNINLTPITVYSVQLKDGSTALLQRVSNWEGLERLSRVDQPDQSLIVQIEPKPFHGLFGDILGKPTQPLAAVVVKGSPELVTQIDVAPSVLRPENGAAA
jgi:hypothetical protein